MTCKISYKNEVLRKLIHLSSLWMVGVIYVLTHDQAIVVFGVIFLGMFLFEILRRYSRFAQSLTQKILGNILRSHETIKGDDCLTGAFYMTLAVLMAVFLFSKPVAMSAIAIMLVADTAAALIGRKLGKHCVLDKTWEGSLAFFVAATFVLYLSSYWELSLNFWEILAVAVGASLIELFATPLRIDDNLVVVLGTGALLTVIPLFMV